jgi:hypothetical protein
MRATVQNWGLAGRDADLQLGWPTEGRSWNEWAVVVIDVPKRVDSRVPLQSRPVGPDQPSVSRPGSASKVRRPTGYQRSSHELCVMTSATWYYVVRGSSAAAPGWRNAFETHCISGRNLPRRRACLVHRSAIQAVARAGSGAGGPRPVRTQGDEGSAAGAALGTASLVPCHGDVSAAKYLPGLHQSALAEPRSRVVGSAADSRLRLGQIIR